MRLDQIIETHPELNDKLWYANNLRKEVAAHLLMIAKSFVEFIDIPDLHLHDIIISGSNASFNYNSHSDIDLHLVVNEQDKCWDLLQELFMAKKSLFNEQHDISIRGINVEVYVQPKGEKHISNGVYSVIHDKWIKQPKPIIADIDESNVKHKFEYMKNEIDQAIASGDFDKISKVKQAIKKMRRSGLAKNGEYGAENLTFKLLRNEGLLDKLSNEATRSHDKSLSI